MKAEIREFNLTHLPFTIRFGLGSTEAIKRWARFKITKKDELFWIDAMDIRRDVDSTDTHISVHKNGKIVSSIYQGKSQERRKIYSHRVGDIGNAFRQIIEPHQVTSGNYHLQPSFLYCGLETLTDEQIREASGEIFVPCLDNRLVNSKLYYSLDLLPWVANEQVIAYASIHGRPFDINDPRSHMFIFRYGQAAIVITMRFNEGDEPIDIKQVTEADKDRHPLKRLL